MAVERSRSCLHLGRLCEELGISRSQLRAWRKQLLGPEDPDGRKRPPHPEREAAASEAWTAQALYEENLRLKRALGEKVLEADFFKGALEAVEARRRPNSSAGAKTSTPTSGR
jgi:transposase-like protein